jgi:hypothetical protein
MIVGCFVNTFATSYGSEFCQTGKSICFAIDVG